MDKHFIKTTDQKTAEDLLRLGFVLISHNKNEYVFLNESTKDIQFFDADAKKIVYSNILSI